MFSKIKGTIEGDDILKRKTIQQKLTKSETTNQLIV